MRFQTATYSLMVKSPEGADHAMRMKSTSLSGVEVDVIKYNPENNDGAIKDTATEVVSASDADLQLMASQLSAFSNTITDLFSGVTVELSDVSQADLARIS